ncbi:hypothetical protein DFQ27_008310 [Actinomortierella ambigua]|uniref:Uncharacterized protein n=1 Tax=Actinomortierella ambigua TaxID=1343610 RepID=A0A9P6TYJ3_9FUNG|nr:hypothetical protein DFQ27_008310 [Actinomortierella ambigua]
MGQVRKEFGSHSKGQTLFITEWMLELWRGGDMHAAVLDKVAEEESALASIERFLAMNKDVLTGAEFEILVRDYSGESDISMGALS